MPPRKRSTPPVSATFAPTNLPSLVTPDTPPPAAEPTEKPAPKAARPRSRKAPQPPAEPAPAPVAQEPVQTYSPVGVRKQRSVYLEEDLWQRGRGFVAWVQYEEVPGEADTMADLVSEALNLLLTQKEAKYVEDGGTFRGPARKLRRGAGAAGKSRMSAEVRKQSENRS